MTAPPGTNAGQSHQSNGGTEYERLATLVRELQDECNRLRQALAKMETERDLYRKAMFENARTAREFQDVDIATLEAMSAGPVDRIE
jgi:hypothetical protein